MLIQINWILLLILHDHKLLKRPGFFTSLDPIPSPNNPVSFIFMPKSSSNNWNTAANFFVCYQPLYCKITGMLSYNVLQQ